MRVRNSLPQEIAATIFPRTFNNARDLQGGSILFGTISLLAAWLVGGGLSWLVAGLLFFSIIPITLCLNVPIGKQLSNPSIDKNAPSTKRLIQDWDKFHYVRTTIAALALVICNLGVLSGSK